MTDGGCLCGAAGWTYDGSPWDTSICNCSVCRRYGAIWAYGYLGQEVATWGETSAFATGSKSCDFHFCPTCGSVTHYRDREPSADGRLRVAVNLRMAVDPASIRELKLLHFEGAVSMQDVVPGDPGMARHVRDLWL